MLEKIINSPECKGFLKRKETLLKEYQEKNPEADLSKIRIVDIKGLAEIFNEESKLSIEKIDIHKDSINTFKDIKKDVNSNDFTILRIFVNFI